MAACATQRDDAAGLWRSRGPDVGLLVVGHGTADPVGAEETRTVTRLVAALLPGVPVELGFLEVIGPSIDDACAALAARGCTAAVAAPLLLFTAGHARRDVPEALAAAARAHRIALAQSDALGCHPAIVELSRLRRVEAMASLPPVAAAETALVAIGRGSSAPDAAGQLREFMAATRADDPLGAAALELGFVAAARPTVDESLAQAVARRPRRIVVQPHLLFRGHVEDQVSGSVRRFQELHPAVEWVVVPRLGADPLVAVAVAERALAALDGRFAVPDSTIPAGKNASPEPA